MNTRALKFSALLLAAAAMPAAAQSIPTLAARAATAFSANGGVNDLAFNDKSNVYLQVWGHPAVWGAFVSADGALPRNHARGSTGSAWITTKGSIQPRWAAATSR